ncbi:MAG: cyclic nucleotide-binding domain-containing protein, partial [Steroidobacteraceae bacterium]
MSTSLYESRREQMFPKLSEAQIGRLLPRGHVEITARGANLVSPGERSNKLLIVLSGSLEILGPSADDTERLVHVAEANEFLGEVSTLRGTAAQVFVRVREPGRVLVIT